MLVRLPGVLKTHFALKKIEEKNLYSVCKASQKLLKVGRGVEMAEGWCENIRRFDNYHVPGVFAVVEEVRRSYEHAREALGVVVGFGCSGTVRPDSH